MNITYLDHTGSYVRLTHQLRVILNLLALAASSFALVSAAK